jgi:hypothetical protein
MRPEYLVVVDDDRGRVGASWRGVGTAAAAGAVAVFLYLLVRSLGERGRALLPPPRPKDEQRLTFVMTQPTESARPMSFRLLDEGTDTRVYALEDLIARVKAGGRSDVTLKIAGNVIESSAQSALALIKQAGIEVWKDVTSIPRVAGNNRGQYGTQRRSAA